MNQAPSTTSPQNKGTPEMNVTTDLKNKNNKNNKNNKKEVASPFNFIPSLFHTFSKLLPIGLYVSTLLESVVFNDIRGFIIFIGLVINDIINIGYNYLLEKKPKEQCAIIRNIYTDDFFELSTSHTQYISFITGFIMSSMFFKKVFYYSTFTIFTILTGLTVWSRIVVGCEDFLDSGYNLIFGLFRGIIYYIIVKDYYEPDDVTPDDNWVEKILRKYLPKGDEDDEFN